ncbi:unnamed protein product [Pedinophyceae sp. YPF-701]|nr:unnamed protein product [Pedinophyceae sp. YPF-701]
MPTKEKAPADGPFAKLTELGDRAGAWVAKQPPPVECLLVGLQQAATGAVMGFTFTFLNQKLMESAKESGADIGPMANMMMGNQTTPAAMARNFAILLGVNSGVTLAAKRARDNVEDVWNAITGAFASGAAFSVVNGIDTGSITFEGAVTTGGLFAAFQGVFYKIGQSFGGGKAADEDYVRVSYMLEQLGLEKYEKNMKKAMLDDQCLLLLNDGALQEAKIPPGPRLQIMNMVNYYRAQQKGRKGADMALKPAFPIDGGLKESKPSA